MLRHIHPQAQPHDLTIIPGAAPGDPDPERLLVLELAGGEAARRGLVPGTTLRHPAVPQATAAAPATEFRPFTRRAAGLEHARSGAWRSLVARRFWVP